MATLDKAWTKSLAEEVLGEENATNENVDAFYESDRSLILDKASRGRSLRDAIAASWALSDRLSVKSALRRRDRETSRS